MQNERFPTEISAKIETKKSAEQIRKFPGDSLTPKANSRRDKILVETKFSSKFSVEENYCRRRQNFHRRENQGDSKRRFPQKKVTPSSKRNSRQNFLQKKIIVVEDKISTEERIKETERVAVIKFS